MNTPPLDYLALVNQSLGPAPATPAPAGPAPSFLQQAGAALGAPPSAERGIIDNTAAAGGFSLSPPALPAGPPPAPAGPPPPPPGPAPEPPQAAFHPRPFPLVQARGAGVVNVPAHETELRGPTLRAAQGARNAAVEGAIQAVQERNEQTGAADFALALEQERKAKIREDAANYSAAERAEEMAERQADFDKSVKALSSMHVDPARFYAGGETTGSKVAAAVKLMLSMGIGAAGGYLGGKTGTPNQGLQAINDIIARDIRAQEFSFQAARDTVHAKQTAFSMAMQKYNNVDAARAAARAAALDAAQSQIQQQAAMWKTADAQNRATMALAALQDEKVNQIQQGIAFMPARQVAAGPVWVDPETGISYNEAQARELSKDVRGQRFEEDKQSRGVAGQLLVEGAKADKAAQKDIRAELVQLPNGDTIRARDPAEAKDLSKLAASVSQAQQLVNEAKQIRSGTAWRIPGTSERARLEAIQSELTLSFKDRGGLGALSGPDMELALNATGDITSQRPTAEAKLDSFSRATNNALRARVKTIPDAPGTAKGEMPASFKGYGKK